MTDTPKRDLSRGGGHTQSPPKTNGTLVKGMSVRSPGATAMVKPLPFRSHIPPSSLSPSDFADAPLKAFLLVPSNTMLS